MLQIALLGAAPSSYKLAPFGDVNWEIWACSPPNYQAPRVDAWFELHSVDRKMQASGNAPYIEMLRQHPRVYLAAKHPVLPNAFLYPRDAMLQAFYPYGNYFFTSSLAWMMAMAIVQKPARIGLWGVDMSATEEYGYQRAGCHYFISRARELGIDIYTPPQSDLLQPVPLYGFKEQTRMYWKQKARLEELTERLNRTRDHKYRLEAEERVFQGAIDDLNYVNNTWLDDGYRDWPSMAGLPGAKRASEEPVNGEVENRPDPPRPKKSRRAPAGDDPISGGVQLN